MRAFLVNSRKEFCIRVYVSRQKGRISLKDTDIYLLSFLAFPISSLHFYLVQYKSRLYLSPVFKSSRATSWSESLAFIFFFPAGSRRFFFALPKHVPHNSECGISLKHLFASSIQADVLFRFIFGSSFFERRKEAETIKQKSSSLGRWRVIVNRLDFVQAPKVVRIVFFFFFFLSNS